MRLEAWRNDRATVLDLEPGEISLGGGTRDTFRLAGEAEGALRLQWDGAQVTALTRESVPIGGALFPRGVRRLLLPGERVELSGGTRLQLLAGPAPSTAHVLRRWLSDRAPEAAGPRLLCLCGADRGRSLPLLEKRMLLGRGRGVTERIHDPAVSRQHAVLVRTPHRTWVQDVGSNNGVFVNGVAITRATELRDGDLIELGHTLLKLFLPDAPARAEGPCAPPRRWELWVARCRAWRRRDRPRGGFALDWLWVVGGAFLAVLGYALTAALGAG